MERHLAPRLRHLHGDPQEARATADRHTAFREVADRASFDGPEVVGGVLEGECDALYEKLDRQEG